MNDRFLNIEQRLLAAEEKIATLLQELHSLRSGCFSAPLLVVDAEGNIILSIDAKKNDSSLKLYARGGKVVASLGVDGTNCGYLTLRDQNEKIRVYMNVETAGGKLDITGANNKSGVVIYNDGEGGGGINILNNSGDLVSEFPSNGYSDSVDNNPK